MSVYRTIGPLVSAINCNFVFSLLVVVFSSTWCVGRVYYFIMELPGIFI